MSVGGVFDFYAVPLVRVYGRSVISAGSCPKDPLIGSAVVENGDA